MKITIGVYDPETRSVQAQFQQGDIVHDRSVNAVHTTAGDYDEAATAARVQQVSLGVRAKIELGVITVATPADVLPTAEVAQEAPAA